MSDRPLWKTLEDAMEREFGGGGGLVDLALAAWTMGAGVWVPDGGLHGMREWWRALADRLGLGFEQAFVDDRGALVCSTVPEDHDRARCLTWVDSFHARRLAAWALDEFGAGQRWIVVRMAEDALGPEDRRALSPRLGLRLRAQDASEPVASHRWAEVLARTAPGPREGIAFDAAAVRSAADALTCAEGAWRTVTSWFERLAQHPELDGADDGHLPTWTFRLGYAIAAMKGEHEASEESLRRVLPAVLDARVALFPEARLEGGTVRGVLRSLSAPPTR